MTRPWLAMSMSDAVRYLALHLDSLGGLAGLADMTLTDLGLVPADMPAADDPAFHGSADEAPSALVTVRPTMPAIEAFELMCRLGVSGVGVTDDGGNALIANLAGLHIARHVSAVPFHPTSASVWSHSTQHSRQCGAIPPNIRVSVEPFHKTMTWRAISARPYSLSASDVRCLQPEHFGMLGLPVAELLALLHGRGAY